MLEELIEELKKYDRAEISYKSGVSIGTVNTIMSGANKDPKLSTLTALRAFVDAKHKQQEKQK